MPIDGRLLGRLGEEARRHLAVPFPEAPGGDEIGEWFLDLLLVDPSIGAKLTSVVNGNYDVIDFTQLREDLDEVSLLEERLKHIDFEPEDAHLKDAFAGYVRSLFEAGNLLFTSWSSDCEDG